MSSGPDAMPQQFLLEWQDFLIEEYYTLESESITFWHHVMAGYHLIQTRIIGPNLSMLFAENIVRAIGRLDNDHRGPDNVRALDRAMGSAQTVHTIINSRANWICPMRDPVNPRAPPLQPPYAPGVTATPAMLSVIVPSNNWNPQPPPGQLIRQIRALQLLTPNHIPHYKGPIAFQPELTSGAIRAIRAEMDEIVYVYIDMEATARLAPSPAHGSLYRVDPRYEPPRPERGRSVDNSLGSADREDEYGFEVEHLDFGSDSDSSSGLPRA